MTNLFDNEKEVADVEGDVTAKIWVESQIAHRTFPYTVEVNANQFTVGIDDRTSRIASGSMIGCKETYWLVVVSTFSIDIAQSLWNIVVEDVWIILFYDSFEGGDW